MADIEIIGKWDNKTKKWNPNPSLEDYGRSFAFANYDCKKKDNSIHYIFFSPGERVEDHSKDFKTISIKENRMDEIIRHYEEKRETYQLKMFLMDADAPIREDAKLFAKYVENICKKKDTKSVTLVGFSKCSVMNCYVPKYFKKKST